MQELPPAAKNKPCSASCSMWFLLADIAGTQDEHERIRFAARGVPRLMPCIVSGGGLLKENGTDWDVLIYQGADLLPREETEAVFREVRPVVEQAFSSGEPQIVEKIPDSLRERGVEVLAVSPMQTAQRPCGFLIIGRDAETPFNDEEKFTASALSTQFAVGIENLRLYHEQRRHSENLQGIVNKRTKEMRTLLDLNNRIVGELDRSSLLGAISRSLRENLDFDACAITIYDPDRELFTLYAMEGSATDPRLAPIGSAFRRKGSPLGKVLEEGRPVINRDLPKEPHSPDEQRLVQMGVRARIVVPLIAKGRTIGTLNIGSREPDRYTPEQAEFLQGIARQVALAIENMLAYEEIAELKSRLEQENLYLQEEIKTEHNFEEIIGQSEAIRKVLKNVEQVAPTDASVLITGETGTGKELIARAIHNLGTRKDKPLVKVNCAALPAGLIESELFGHEKGAFTGALKRKIGRFELADGGSLFLDEIGEVPMELQTKLLRVLQEGEFERVGGTDMIKVDVRVIAGTNRDLQKASEEGTFRADLFYRLNVFPIQVPPLRDRQEDIPLLVQYFATRCAADVGKKVKSIHPRAMEALKAYSWPGNVRELAHLIERAVILSRDEELKPGPWLPKTVPRADRQRLHTLDELQKEHIVSVLEHTGWRVSGEKGAAKILGLKPTTLEARMKKLGIKRA